MTFITTILRLNMRITQNYSSRALTLSHMKLRSKIFYKDINPDIEKRFDTSDYPTNHPSDIKTELSSKVLGIFKDDAGGKQIVEFVGLRAKLYSYKMLDGSEDKKCKGVSKNVRKRSIQFDDYLECLFSRKKQYRNMNVMVFMPEKLIKLPSLLTMTSELLWLTEYTLYLTDIKL